MTEKLIFVDVDGTLTSPGDVTPPDSALEAIKKAQASGNKVFLCTGRNLAMTAPLLKYGFDGYVASAGGYISVGDEIIYDKPMTDEQFRTSMRLLQKHDVVCTVETKDGSYCDPDMGKLLDGVPDGNSELERWRRQVNENLGIEPLDHYNGSKVYKIVIMFREMSQIEEAEEAVGKDFDFVLQDDVYGVRNGELINRAYDKGRGVLRVCEHLGVPVSDTYGFGDSMNDYAMIKTVGTSVCMANGSTELKKISDVICPSVDEDGLARAFSSLGLDR
jgi:Cof subfamily protein (haloacid dehalogenase superfamily)